MVFEVFCLIILCFPKVMIILNLVDEYNGSNKRFFSKRSFQKLNRFIRTEIGQSETAQHVRTCYLA